MERLHPNVTAMTKITSHQVVNTTLGLLPLSSWLALFTYRICHADSTVFTDAITLLLCAGIAAHRGKELNDRDDFLTSQALVIAFATVAALAWRYKNLNTLFVNNVSKTNTEKARRSPLLPLIFPARTVHARQFPKRHSFAYSYLLVGIPVDWEGCKAGLLSAGNCKRRGWFHVDPKDYLTRGPEADLRERLSAYLNSVNVPPADFPNAYLVTAPRFLGYCFNPVSFWYLYDAESQLKAMILEVNNTFDERRAYFLNISADKQHPSKFRYAWDKDFHVSPFNDRNGKYELVAQDPRPFRGQVPARMSNSITLRNAEDKVTTEGRVFSTAPPMNPDTLSLSDRGRLILSWCWVGFLTFPRILKEAWKLFFTKKLQVWFRPEVVDTSIPRHATSTEILLQGYFAAHLAFVVHKASFPVTVEYRPAQGMGLKQKFVSDMVPKEDNKLSVEATLQITVTTPAFYSRLVHYAHYKEAFDRESLFTNALNQTVLVSDANLLERLLRDCDTRKDRQLTCQTHTILHRWQWNFLRRIRCAPEDQPYPNGVNNTGDTRSPLRAKDIRALPFSPLDMFVMKFGKRSAAYRRKVCALFLAQRFFFGATAIPAFLDFALRMIFVIVTLYLQLNEPGQILRGTGRFEDRLGRDVVLCICFNMQHIWSLIKGV